MRIVIVGAGFTGIQLAKLLINEKNQVAIVDNDENTIRHASNQLDCTVMCADGNNLETLEELELDLHGADEHKTVDRGVLVDEHTPIVVDYRWLDIEIGVVALVAQFVVDIIGPFAPGVGDAHGIPVELVVVGLLTQVAVEAAVVVEEQELVLVKQLERFWIGDKDRCARAWDTSGNNWFFRLVAHHPKCLYTAIFATSKSIGISKLYLEKPRIGA